MTTRRDDGPVEHTAITTPQAPKPVAHYSQAVRVGELVFVAGQGPVEPLTGSVVSGDIAIHTEQTLRNVVEILRGAGATLDQVVSVRVYLTDFRDFSGFNEVFGAFFGAVPVPPARTTVYVGLPPGMSVEIDVVAHLQAGRTSIAQTN